MVLPLTISNETWWCGNVWQTQECPAAGTVPILEMQLIAGQVMNSELGPRIKLLFLGEISMVTLSLTCFQIMQIVILFVKIALLGTNISHQKSCLKMIFLFPRWEMLVPWRVIISCFV